MLIPEIVQYLGRYCEITTARNQHIFGELGRLSTAVFWIRAPHSQGASPIQTVEAAELVEITELPLPHR